MGRDSIEEEQLCGTGEEGGTHARVEGAEGARGETIDEVAQRDPAAENGVVDRVGERGITGREARGIERGEVEIGISFSLMREGAVDGITGGFDGAQGRGTLGA
jgi:hypothetical protein